MGAFAQWRIVEATLLQRTDRYGHGVLGGNEYSAMIVDYLFQSDLVYRQVINLPDDRVFEDIKARIVDLGGPWKGSVRARQHIVVVESSRAGGAELVVYGLGEGRVEKITSTPPIGRRNRWLAVAGIADFDGDGQNDIAYVETPHIGGTLRIWTMRDGDLVQIASEGGFSNHRIGQDFITGGVRDCGNGFELVLPNFNWSRLMVASLQGGKITARALGAPNKDAIAAALACRM